MTIEKLHKVFLECNGISTDTRKITQDSLFFALKGANFNANEFAAEALEKGCKFAVIDEEKYAVDNRFILVEDVQKTLQNLATYHRRQFKIPVIGITGSNGKTTTKELAGAVLQTTYETLITEGNLNNHLGVPMTLLRLNMDHEMAIIEMGANRPGDIAELCEIAEPTHGIITNIGAAHIEGFGSLDGVIQTKTGLYRFIEKNNGTLFCNADDHVLKNNLPLHIPVVYYGEKEGRITGKISELTPFVNFTWKESDYQSEVVKTNLVGTYNFTNFLAAICIGRFFGIEADKINQALSNYFPSNKRSQFEKTKRNSLIVDCYNANATSMMAALQNFVAIPSANKIAILGDMLELGEISQTEHQRISDFAKKHQLKTIFVGKEFQKVDIGGQHFLTSEELKNAGILSEISDHLILVKGSRGIKLESIIEML